jgi:chitinase
MEEQAVTPPQKRKPFALLILVILSPLLMGALCFGTGPTAPRLKAPGGMLSGDSFGANDINHLKIFATNNGWATTRDLVMRTSDGGKSWIDVTPADWEPLDKSESNIQGIIGACFLDANHAWLAVSERVSQADIDAASTATSNIAASPVPTVDSHGHSNIDTSHIPTAGTYVYVRSTVDGGKTWMTSNFMPVDNLAGSSEINFFNQHEGWMELATEVVSTGTYIGSLYSTSDGGVTWSGPEDEIPGSYGAVITTQNAITGMTAVKSSPCPPDTLGPSSYRYCTEDDGSTVQGCRSNLLQPGQTETILGWAGAMDVGHTLLTSTSNGAFWSQDYTTALLTPGGAPKQGNDSSFVSSPPTIFGDGNGILPVEIQGDPDGNDPSHFFLHLFTIAINPTTQGYTIQDASPTSDFDTQFIAGMHTLSAPDAQHVFVVGQEYNADDSTGGNVNLYEFVNGGWQKLNTQFDATITAPASGMQAAPFNAYLANLDFISDTEGWATNGTSLYHITIDGGNATWSLVSTATTSAKNLTNTSLASSRFTLIKREPGKLIPAPTNPPPCYDQEAVNKKNPSGLPAHTLTGYWQNFTNGAKPLKLTDVNANYDLIAVAFAGADPTKPGGVTFSVDPDLARALGGYSDAQFISDITSLHQQGKKVVLSVGGQNGSISVASDEAAKNFANSVFALQQKYGFDGVDIDLEQGINVTYMANALQQLSDQVKNEQQGVMGQGGSMPNLIITLAPQTVDMQSTQASYFQLALKIKDILTIVNMQYYNSGTMNGCDGNVYAQGSVDFLTAQACIQAQGGLSPGQIGLGLPASTAAAGSGYVDPLVVKSAISCLSSGQSCGSFKPSTTYAIQDVMTWSINWDASNNYQFAKTVKGG